MENTPLPSSREKKNSRCHLGKKFESGEENVGKCKRQ
jgi:hypothetical protein